MTKIKRKRALKHKADSNFYPNLKFIATALYNEDLITDKEDTEIYSARIELSYNLFKGNRDKVLYEREKLFLAEEQKTKNAF